MVYMATMETILEARPLPLPTATKSAPYLSSDNITSSASNSSNKVHPPVNRISQALPPPGPRKKKVVYRYDRETLYALCPAVTQRPPDLPLMLCRDEPGNLKQEMEAKLIARRMSNKSPQKEVDTEKGSDDFESDGDGKEPTLNSSTSTLHEIRSDEIVLGPPPHKPFPSSSTSTIIPVTPQAPFSDFDDLLSGGASRGYPVSNKPKPKSRKPIPDDTLLRSPRKAQLPNGKNSVQTPRDDKQTPTIATPKPKIEQQIPKQHSSEVPSAKSDSILDKLLTAKPSITPSLHPVNHVTTAESSASPNPNPSSSSPTSLFLNSVTSSQVDVDVDSFFAPGNDSAPLHQIFRKQFVHSNPTTACVDNLLKEDHFSSFITPAALPLSDSSSYVSDFLNPPVDGPQLEEETGEVVLSRGFGRWFNTFDEDPTEIIRSLSPLPQHMPTAATAPLPTQAASVLNSLPHFLQPPMHYGSSASTTNADGNTPIDVLLRNAFQAYEERIAAPPNKTPTTAAAVTANGNYISPPTAYTSNIDSSIFPVQDSISTSIPPLIASEPSMASSYSSSTTSASTVESGSVVDIDLTAASVENPRAEPPDSPPSPPEEAKPVSPTSNHHHHAVSNPILSIPLPPPATAPLHNGRSQHGRQLPHTRSANTKRDPNKPPSAHNSKRLPSHHNSTYNSASSSNHINNPRKKKDGHKVTGLLAPPTQPQAFLVNFNALQTPHHPHHPHHPHFALGPQPMQTFFVPHQPIPHHPPIAHQHLAGHHNSHSNHHTSAHHPVPLAGPPANLGLEKWFGPAILSQASQHEPLPSMPKAARVLSVQEIENQMNSSSSSVSSSSSSASSSPSPRNHHHNHHHSNNYHGGHRNSK